MKFTFIKYNADASMLKVFGIVFPKYFNAASVTPQLIQNELDRCTFASPVFSNKADDPAARDLKGNISPAGNPESVSAGYGPKYCLRSYLAPLYSS